MKKLLLTIPLFLLVFAVQAQKFAYVDTEYILQNIPNYETAQQQLDDMSKKWQTEIEEIYASVEKLYKTYQAEEVLLTDEQKRKRQEEIITKENEAKALQKKYFARDGMLFNKRQELVKPIQDEVFNAVKEIAEEGSYAFIFDVSGSVSILYSNPKYDLSDLVLEKLGYKN
jgi:outer membrane protein